MRRFLARDEPPEERLEHLLAERRRELEEHAARFAAKIEDLEHREQLVRDARASVERLLRLGTTDLDERELELTQLVADLTEREQRIRAEEADLTRRRAELGAVELRRAAIERRERVLDEREAKLAAPPAGLEEPTPPEPEPPPPAEREAALEPQEPEAGEDAAEESAEPGPLLLLVPGAGYRLVEIAGPAVVPGSTIELEGVAYTVSRTGRSPLPGDRRPCAYLVREPGGVRSLAGSS